jgi:hypothetical protein
MKKTKLYLFSSDFFPSNLVASQRATFWAKYLNKHLNSKIFISIITENQKAKYIKGVDKLFILNKFSLKGFLGKIWNILELSYILFREKTPAVVILSTGPFYILASCIFIPERHSLIFDLRDPFLNDSKYSVNKLKYYLRKHFQNWFLNQPSALIFINDFLRKSYSPPPSKPCLIIPNGFDSNKISIPNKNKKILILGKVYENLEIFIKSSLEIDPELEFHQYINQSKILPVNKLPEIKKVYIHDEISKLQISKICSQYGFGLISSYPEDFVLPVKIFDYAASNQKIIILGDKNCSQTEIKEFLKNYPNKFFCYEQLIPTDDFVKFLNSKYEPFNLSMIDKKYFRKDSIKFLSTFLEKYF